MQARQHEDAERQKECLTFAAERTTSASHVDSATSHKPAQCPSGWHDKQDSGKKSHGGEALKASRSSHSGHFQLCGHEFHRWLDCPAAKALCSHRKKRGHFSLVCRSKKPLESVELHAVVAVAQNGRYI
ncbi:hypothetical protein MRX96_030491 [Rhipicephalus microplus]